MDRYDTINLMLPSVLRGHRTGSINLFADKFRYDLLLQC